MRFDWFVQKSGARRIAYVPSASVISTASGTFGSTIQGEELIPLRWAVVREPRAVELRSNDLGKAATEMFAQLGPVGCFFGEVVQGPCDFSHPTVGQMRVRPTKFGMMKGPSVDAHTTAIAERLGWQLTDKERWWVFERQASAEIQDPWVATAVALAIIYGRTTSLISAEGWKDNLELRLEALRGRRRTAEVSRALLGTIDTLLEFGAVQLAEERLAAFRDGGGAEFVALPYAVQVAWFKQQWNEVVTHGQALGRTSTPGTAWRVAWAELELGLVDEAARRLDRFSDPPQSNSSTGRWFRVTRAAVEAARNRLEYSVRLLADFPRTDPLASARDRVAHLIEESVRGLLVEGKPRLLAALGQVSEWNRDDLPEELRRILGPHLVSPSIIGPATPTHDEDFERWAQRSTHARADKRAIRIDAERLLERELTSTRSPVRVSMLVVAAVPTDVGWRPSPTLLALLRQLEPGVLGLSPESQASLARAYLLEKDAVRARSWADQASHALIDLDSVACQAIAEALAPEVESASERAQEAWLRVLSEPPRWTARPRIGSTGDLLRERLANALAEQLFVSSEYSRLIELLLTELEPLSSWAQLWSARSLVLILLDALCEASDRERAFDVAAQLWPVALAAGAADFAMRELARRFDDSHRLGPLDPSGWQIVLEGVAPYAKAPGFEALRDWLSARASSLLARAPWLASDPDFDPLSLFDLLQKQGIDLPAELRPVEPTVPPKVTTAQRGPKSVLIVGGYPDVQRRAVDELESRGVRTKTLNPGFDENVDEKTVREALGDIERVVVVWRCILHRVSITLDQLLSRPDFTRIERVFARGKGHSSIVAAAVGAR